jgi:hypothetical protein
MQSQRSEFDFKEQFPYALCTHFTGLNLNDMNSPPIDVFLGSTTKIVLLNK